MKFVIFAEVAGEIVKCFTWTRNKLEGIERARVDARNFGYEPTRIWAEEV